MPRQNVFDMSFEKIYSLLVQKAEHKGSTKDQVDEVILCLTGYPNIAAIGDVTYGEFLANAPEWNPRAELIKGTICGVRVENIEDPMTKKMRQLDKLIDDLSKGKSITIMR